MNGNKKIRSQQRWLIFSVIIPLVVILLLGGIILKISGLAVASLVIGVLLLIYVIGLYTYNLGKVYEEDKISPWLVLVIAIGLILLGILLNMKTCFMEKQESSSSIVVEETTTATTSITTTIPQVEDVSEEITTTDEVESFSLSIMPEMEKATTTSTPKVFFEEEDEEEVETTTTTRNDVPIIVTTSIATTTDVYIPPVVVTTTYPKQYDTTQPAVAHSHSYSAWKYNEYQHWKECTGCGKQKSLSAHSFKVSKNVSATCTSDGYTKYKCTKCGYSYKETIKATGQHSYDAGKVTKQATCNQNGVKTYTCKICGQTRTESIPASGNHQYDNGKVTAQATCTSNGVKTYTCKICGQTRTESIPASGSHQYDNGKVTKEATCTTNGVKTYTCLKCGQTKTETIQSGGQHSYSVWKYNESSHYKECSSCHQHAEEGSHIFDAGNVTTPATEYSTGVKTYKCTVCGYEKTESIPMLEKAKGKLEVSFGQGSYPMGSVITVTIRYTGTSLSGLRMSLAGMSVNPQLVVSGDGWATYNIEIGMGFSGTLNLVVDADGYDTAYGYVNILEE